MEEKNELTPVDVDLIRQLRFQGDHLEADRLVKAHQAALKKNYNQIRKQGVQESVKLRRVHYFRLGLCVVCGKVNDRKPLLKCSVCFARSREKRLKVQKERYERGVCVLCGGKLETLYRSSCKKCSRARNNGS